MKNPLINDSQSLISAKGRFGHAIPVYDDGYGNLYIHRDSMGISGIVRAQSWEEAYSICEDEFFPAATEAEEEFIKEYGEDFMENGCWQEAYGFRNNSRTEEDGTQSSLYQKDINGDSLDLLTAELMERLEITLEIKEEEIETPPQRFFLWHESRWTNKDGRQVFTMNGRYGAGYAKISPAFVARKRGLVNQSHCSPTWEN